MPWPCAVRASNTAVCCEGVEYGQKYGHDVVILDTAGRLHIDEDLMKELVSIKEKVRPHEILLVVDAMTGQDAVNIATHFNGALDITGVILTKLDGDARGGAVLSIRQVTGKPIRLLGMGEKLDQLEPFFPDRMASRILGMGDVLSLIEKAERTYSLEEVEGLKGNLKGNNFTLEDFRTQLKQMKKLGSLTDLIAMIPGGSRMLQKAGGDIPEDGLKHVEAIINSMTVKERKDMKKLGSLTDLIAMIPGGSRMLQKAGGDIPEDGLKHVEAIINSMTVKERKDYTLIDGSRRKRIARGSGTRVEEVNRLLKQFLQTRKMVKSLAGGKGKFSMMQKARSLFS